MLAHRSEDDFDGGCGDFVLRENGCFDFEERIVSNRLGVVGRVGVLVFGVVSRSWSVKSRKASDQLEELAMGESGFEAFSPEPNYSCFYFSDNIDITRLM